MLDVGSFHLLNNYNKFSVKQPQEKEKHLYHYEKEFWKTGSILYQIFHHHTKLKPLNPICYIKILSKD